MDIWISSIHILLIRSLWVPLLVANCRCQDCCCSDIIRILPKSAAIKFGTFEFLCHIWNQVFPITKHLCQTLDCVCSCVDLTDNNVISVPLSVRMPEISQAFCRRTAHLEWPTEIVKFDSKCPSFSLSLPTFYTAYREIFVEFWKFYVENSNLTKI